MKLQNNNASHVKVPLECLRITSNVRLNFDEEQIKELAVSIKENGLINAITVKPPVEENGVKYYEVIAGGRRIRALKWLCDHGDDFSMVDCKVSNGDAWTIQMIENIQRADLSPREKESALALALENGLTQTQIADRLSKPISWVSDTMAGAKVRRVADAQGLKTDEISTKTLSQLRSIPDANLPEVLSRLVSEGGSYRTATRLAQEWKAEQEAKAYGQKPFFAPEAATNASSKEEDPVVERQQIQETEKEEEDAFAMVEHELPEEEEATCSKTETVAPDPETKTREIVNKPDYFIWEISNELDMEAAILSLRDKIKKMPQNTKLCIKDCGRVLTISGIEYRPGTNELVFMSQTPDARVLG